MGGVLGQADLAGLEAKREQSRLWPAFRAIAPAPRSHLCRIRLTDGRRGRQFATRLSRLGGGIFLGLLVRGRQVESSRLSPGDEVSMGTTRFVFDIEQ